MKGGEANGTNNANQAAKRTVSVTSQQIQSYQSSIHNARAGNLTNEAPPTFGNNRRSKQKDSKKVIEEEEPQGNKSESDDEAENQGSPP